MINIPMKTKAPLNQGSLTTVNIPAANGILTAQTILTLNKPSVQNHPTVHTASPPAPARSDTPASASAPVRGQAEAPASAPVRSSTSVSASAPIHSSTPAPAPVRSQAQVSAPVRSSTPAPAPVRSQAQVSAPVRSSTPAPAPVRSHVQASAPAPARKPLPAFTKPVQKGQKATLAASGSLPSIRACFGWNTTDPQCDVDVSAFLLGADQKVLGDSWFVFYGQTISPDKSTQFHVTNTTDREMITIDFTKLNPTVKKIVFVLTINDAYIKKLHFGMMADAYIRILDSRNRELISYKMTDYYSNVISMMIGEIYDYKGTWKFNAVGNGVAKDLAGLCALYGVQISD